MATVTRALLFLLLILLPVQPTISQILDWDAMRDLTARTYVTHQTADTVTVDGRLDESAWDDAPWSEAFVDIRGSDHPEPVHETHMKILWDADHLYVGARLIEPHVWGTLTEKNSIIYQDNDFEIFIDPNGDRHNYYEFEINPLNTIMELTMNRPYADGGDYQLGTNIRGLRSAVYVEGTLNAPHDVDTAWTLEVAIPWEGIKPYSTRTVPPADGEQWRINFSRVQWQHAVDDNIYVKAPDTSEDNWVWSPTGIVDMHRPERWGYVQFAASGSETAAFRPDPTQSARDVLMEVYYRQRHHADQHGSPAESLDELGLPPGDERLRAFSPDLIVLDDGSYTITIHAPTSGRSSGSLVIDHEGRIREEKP